MKKKQRGTFNLGRLLQNNIVPIMFLGICIVCFPLSGRSPAYLLNELVTRSLDEAEIESLVIAKGYEDCVCFMSDEGGSVAVGTGGKGLDEAQVATIADIVLTQSEYELADIRVVEVP